MSIEGIANYEHYKDLTVRPDWERLERLEYCDQGTSSEAGGWMSRIATFFRELF